MTRRRMQVVSTLRCARISSVSKGTRGRVVVNGQRERPRRPKHWNQLTVAPWACNDEGGYPRAPTPAHRDLQARIRHLPEANCIWFFFLWSFFFLVGAHCTSMLAKQVTYELCFFLIARHKFRFRGATLGMGQAR